MKRSIASLAAPACLVALLGAAPAHAAFVTYASETGDNSNDCTSIATPCRSIGGAGGALSKLDAGGIVHVAPGEYGAFELLIPAEIIVDGGQASIINSSVTGALAGIAGEGGITIAVTAGEVVRLRGFILDAGHGVAIGNVGGILHLEDCTFVSYFGGYGIIYQPSAASELYIKDSHFSRFSGATGGGGILIKPVGSGSAKVVLDNVNIEDNSLGILIDGRATTGSNNVTIRNSSIAGSSTYGVAVVDAGGGSTKAVIESTTITSNTTQGVGAYGANVAVRVKNSTISGNGQGLENSGAQLISHGGNAVADNTFNGSFSSTVAPQ